VREADQPLAGEDSGTLTAVAAIVQAGHGNPRGTARRSIVRDASAGTSQTAV